MMLMPSNYVKTGHKYVQKSYNHNIHPYSILSTSSCPESTKNPKKEVFSQVYPFKGLKETIFFKFYTTNRDMLDQRLFGRVNSNVFNIHKFIKFFISFTIFHHFIFMVVIMFHQNHLVVDKRFYSNVISIYVSDETSVISKHSYSLKTETLK